MGPGRELCATDAGTVASTQSFLKECIDTAAVVGAGCDRRADLRVGRADLADVAGRAQAVLRRAARGPAPVAEYGAERGVKVAIEPLVRYETSVINTVEQALEAIDGLPPEGCGLLVDTYHANVEEKDFAAAFTLAGDRLAHVHASANDRGAPGADHIDWPGVPRRAARPPATSGPVVIESFTAENETIATAASVWRPLAAEPGRDRRRRPRVPARAARLATSYTHRTR